MDNAPALTTPELLAVQIESVQKAELGDVYERARDHAHDVMRRSGQIVAGSLVERDEQRVMNTDMLARAMSVLPKGFSSTRIFAANEVEYNILKNTLVKKSSLSYSDLHYIIGSRERPVDKKGVSITDLLLYPVIDPINPPSSVQVNKHLYAGVEAFRRRQLVAPELDQKELIEQWSDDRSEFEVAVDFRLSQYGPGKIYQKYKGDESTESLERHALRRATSSNAEERFHLDACATERGEDTEQTAYDKGLEDELLVSFDVPHHLATLALQFGVSTEMQKALLSGSPMPPSSDSTPLTASPPRQLWPVRSGENS